MKENEIQMVTAEEAGTLQGISEIRFDCLVRMFEMGARKYTSMGLIFNQEKSLPPQWFKSISTMTLEMIKNGDEYSIGRQIKEQFRQLELHIKQYEDFKL